MRAVSMLLLLFIISIPAVSQTYTLVWSDEFDSTAVNTNEWEYEVNGNGGGNNELQYYTSRMQNSFLSGGVFKIMALKESYLGKLYTSARLHTKKSWLYGKIEARMKLPYGKGIWPAFWMLGANIGTVGWPACGEIDIMEMIGGPTTSTGGDGRVFGTAHWYQNGHAQYGLSKALASGRLADEFHTYSILWDDKQIIWYLDGVQYCVINTQPTALNAFRAPHFIILNLAVGGNWPGSPDATTTFPQLFEIDYVRVYQKSTTGVTGTDAVPHRFSLEQNYPNPFNPSTAIRYSIAAESFVTLTVTDLLGRTVQTLVSERQSAGAYERTFDASALPSGMYLCRLTANGSTEVMKMQLLK
ncbi:MAG: family 16 glycosylhydrolase [Bacteroidetes bacterium]|nr:family 16 glycosylhydrolase [Bacteroidota bacterium]